jgi:hypothetical protein
MPALFFEIVSWKLFGQTGLKPPSSYLRCSWDFRHEPRCPDYRTSSTYAVSVPGCFNEVIRRQYVSSVQHRAGHTVGENSCASHQPGFSAWGSLSFRVQLLNPSSGNPNCKRLLNNVRLSFLLPDTCFGISWGTAQGQSCD